MFHADRNEGDLQDPIKPEYNAQTGYLMVLVDMEQYGYLQQPIRYQGKIFAPKNELHITILSAEVAKAVHRFQHENPEDAYQVDDLITDTDWRFRKLERYYHVVEKPGIETVIEMVDLPDLEPFLQDLSKIVGKGFPLPPTHVTLYLLGTEEGILLHDQAAFEELVTSQIKPEEIQPLSGG